MLKTRLVEELMEDGVAILHQLDEQGFPVESMFWVHIMEEEYWRLVIGSSIVSEVGPLKAYSKLGNQIRELDLAGVSSDDVSLLDPDSLQFQSFYSRAIGSSSLAARGEYLICDEAVIYRWTPAAISGMLTCGVSAQELQDCWREERRLTNGPQLLITLHEGRLTLRLHPRQGPQQDVSGLKQAFASALHRLRKDCRVTWET